jgi:hypothetical protein
MYTLVFYSRILEETHVGVFWPKYILSSVQKKEGFSWPKYIFSRSVQII